MLNWLLRCGLNIAGIVFTAHVVIGFEVTVAGAIAGFIVFGLVNATIRPILIFLTFPINLLSLGLFTFVINALMLWLVSLVVRGFELESFGAAIMAAVILMIISSIINLLIKDR